MDVLLPQRLNSTFSKFFLHPADHEQTPSEPLRSKKFQKTSARGFTKFRATKLNFFQRVGWSSPLQITRCSKLKKFLLQKICKKVGRVKCSLEFNFISENAFYSFENLKQNLKQQIVTQITV